MNDLFIVHIIEYFILIFIDYSVCQTHVALLGVGEIILKRIRPKQEKRMTLWIRKKEKKGKSKRFKPDCHLMGFIGLNSIHRLM